MGLEPDQRRLIYQRRNRPRAALQKSMEVGMSFQTCCWLLLARAYQLWANLHRERPKAQRVQFLQMHIVSCIAFRLSMANHKSTPQGSINCTGRHALAAATSMRLPSCTVATVTW